MRVLQTTTEALPMEKSWKQIDEDNERFFEKQMEDAKKSSAADRDFFGAAQLARRYAKQDELLPARNEHGEFRYTAQQGLKAACHAREDIAAALQIQRAVLQRLDRNRNLLWIAITLLAYLTVRLS